MAVPWTDGLGDQVMFAKAVKRLSQFHDNLADIMVTTSP